MSDPGPMALWRFGTLLTPRRWLLLPRTEDLRRPRDLSGGELKPLLEGFVYLQIARGAVNLGVLMVASTFLDQHRVPSLIVLTAGFWTVAFAVVVAVCWACTSAHAPARDQRCLLALMTVSPYVALVLSALTAWLLVTTT